MQQSLFLHTKSLAILPTFEDRYLVVETPIEVLIECVSLREKTLVQKVFI